IAPFALYAVLAFLAEDEAQEFLYLGVDRLPRLAVEIEVVLVEQRIGAVVDGLQSALDVRAAIVGLNRELLELRAHRHRLYVEHRITVLLDRAPRLNAPGVNFAVGRDVVRIALIGFGELVAAAKDDIGEDGRLIRANGLAARVDRLVGPF